VGQKPTAVTDSKICDMMRLFQQEEAADVLKVVDFENIFKATVDVWDQLKESQLPRDKSRGLRRVFGLRT